jgi:hypothetical protein
MNDLDDRMRTCLEDLADEVPSSPHARADLDRRLASRRTRRSTLAVAAAAAVVLAGVAIPVALNQADEPGGQRAATTATTPTPSTGVPGFSADVLPLGSFTEDGVEKEAALVLQGDDQWCVVAVVEKEPPVLWRDDCEPVPTWPQQEPQSLVRTSSVLGDGTLYGGPLPNLLLFVTAPNVETLEVSAGDGEPVSVRVVAPRPDVRFFLAEFPATPAGFGYTAKDAAGNVLESAIT